MKLFRRHWRKFLLPVLIAAVALGVLGAVASKASAQAAQPSISVQHQQELQKRCTHNTPLTAHSHYSAQAHLLVTCTHFYRLYADWQNTGYEFGQSKRTGYSGVCAYSGCNTSGGTLFEAGVERMSDHRMFCEYSCPAAHTTALAMHYHGRHLAQRRCGGECWGYKGSLRQPGWFEAWWDNNLHIWYIRGVAKCGNGTRNKILQTGGWVTVPNTVSKAKCTSSYPDLDGAAYDIKHCSSCSVTRTWVTLPAARIQVVMHYHGVPPARGALAA